MRSMDSLDDKRLYYNIGEVADMFGVNTSLIRYWEKEFDIIKPKKNAKGNRMFTRDDVENFHLIYHLVKEKGYTLDGARQQLKYKHKETLNHFEIIRTLKKLKVELLAIKEGLK